MIHKTLLLLTTLKSPKHLKASTPNKHLEYPSEKNSLHEAVFTNSEPTAAASSKELEVIQLPNDSEEKAVDSKKTEEKKYLRKGQEVFQKNEENQGLEFLIKDCNNYFLQIMFTICICLPGLL
ncbi:hypothetical protein TNIN_147211 [Trichonephila inaurata madagascariensis]|uniref:Uncharacterized protein n=1 Tax=Trichonephila inaurata madagascariensis TaxID=2747483 RepID=A0A8X7CLT2_9ARAC|nr:hypothetical protein TNIN_147211 [Trichonephila inaurata madagascariensis]